MAAAGFRTRRVRTEGVSLGDRLKRARTRRKLSIGEVEDATRIRAKFLLALESDSWEQIPSEVYGRGYLEAYAAFLKLQVDEVMKDYDKMKTVYARHCQEKVELTPRASVTVPKFTLTPKFLLMVGLAIGLLGFASVIGYQLRRYASAPYLELLTPAEAKGDGAPGLVVTTDSVNVTGKTIPGAVVHVNGQLAEMDADGGFSKKLVGLPKDQTTPVVVEAIGQNGRKTQVLASVVVK
jgi:transcriptional regulator with XRE-family HTH domain